MLCRDDRTYTVYTRICAHGFRVLHSPKKCLATLDGEIVDPEITVKLEMRDVRCTNITFIPFDTSNIIVFLIKLG